MSPDVADTSRAMIPANVRSALLLAIGVLLLGGVAAVLIHDDGTSTTRTASTSTTIGSPDTTGTTGATGETSTSTAPGAGGSSSTSTTVASGSFLGGGGPGTEMQRGTEEDVLAYTGWGSPLVAVLLVLGLAAGARATAVAARPR